MQTLTPLRDLAVTPISDAIRRYLLQLAAIRPIRHFPDRRPVVRICALIVNGANADAARFRRDLDRTRAIWGRCVNITEGPVTTIQATLDYPGWTDYTKAPAELLNQRGTCTASDVRAYYVGSIAGDSHQGRSAFTYGQPGYVAMSNDAHENLFSHELGHLFLGGNEEHRDGPSQADRVNIMRSDVGSIEGFPQVDDNQCARAAAKVRSGWAAGGSDQAQTPTVQNDPTAIVRAILVAAGNNIDPVAGLGQALVPHLATIAISDPDPIIRTRAAAALGRIGGATALQALVRSAMDSDPVVRGIAITALGRLRDVAAQMTVVGALQDPAPMVRTAALRALAAIGSSVARAAISERARMEPDPDVRALALSLARGQRVRE